MKYLAGFAALVILLALLALAWGLKQARIIVLGEEDAE